MGGGNECLKTMGLLAPDTPMRNRFFLSVKPGMTVVVTSPLNDLLCLSQ